MHFTLFSGAVCLSLFAVASASPLDFVVKRGKLDQSSTVFIVLMMPSQIHATTTIATELSKAINGRKRVSVARIYRRRMGSTPNKMSLDSCLQHRNCSRRFCNLWPFKDIKRM